MHRLTTLALLVASLTELPAQDWPGFRGPSGRGVARCDQAPSEWSDTQNVAWKVALPGPGASSPIVVGDRVYVCCYSGYGAHLDDGGAPDKLVHHLVCVDRASGKLVFDKKIPGNRKAEAPRMQLTEHGFASPTPVTDGRHIFAYFGTAGVVAFDLFGTVLWQKDTGKFRKGAAKPTNQVVRNGKALTLRWGAAASPVLCGDLVIVNASEESDSIRAYDKKSGALAWTYESANLEGCATSPVVAGSGGNKVVVICLGGEVWGLAPKTGKLIWKVETGTRGGMSPTPVTDGTLVYTFGGYGTSFALKLGPVDPNAKPPESEPPTGDADIEEKELEPEVPFNARIAWRSRNLDIPSPALHDGKLFLVLQSGIGACLESGSGKELFKGRLEGRTSKVYASPVIAGGKVYVVSRKRGTFVYSADGRFKLLARNELDDDSAFNASPAIVDDRIYLRSDTFLYCIGSDR